MRSMNTSFKSKFSLSFILSVCVCWMTREDFFFTQMPLPDTCRDFMPLSSIPCAQLYRTPETQWAGQMNVAPPSHSTCVLRSFGMCMLENVFSVFFISVYEYRVQTEDCIVNMHMCAWSNRNWKGIGSFKTKCLREIMSIKWNESKSSEEIRETSGKTPVSRMGRVSRREEIRLTRQGLTRM